jgi:threonine synthase
MDVGDPSNFERMLWLCNDSYDDMCEEIKGFSCSDAQILDAIKEIHDSYDYISDPHSAVGYLATKHYGSDGFWLSTAHAAKFCEVIEEAIGRKPELPDSLAKAMNMERRFTNMTSEDKDYVVNGKSCMPSVLLEMGFMSSPTDNRLFKQNLEEYAKAIAEAVLQWSETQPY